MTETTNAALGGFLSGLGGLFRAFGKDTPTTGDVHVDAPLGADGKPKKKPKVIPPLENNPGDDDAIVVGKSFDKANVVKVDAEHGLVFGFAIVSTEGGQPYYDVQNDHIPEDAMLSAAVDFMENSRVAKEMHSGDPAGAVVFAFPLTSDIAKALDIEAKKTGLLIAMKPSAAMLEKFKDGTYSGFSIGGSRITDEDVA